MDFLCVQFQFTTKQIVLLYKASFLLREFCGIKILIHNSGAKLIK